MLKNKTPKVSTLLLLVLSLCMLAYVAGFKIARLTSPNFDYVPPQKTVVQSSFAPPVQLEIEFLKINLTIEQSDIVNGNWQISKTGVSHLTSSANPGEPGNIVLYGHNKNSILGNLKRIDVDDIIVLRTFDLKYHTYKVSDVIIATPKDIDWVLPTDTEVLTLFTCIGLADTKRLVVRALPID